MKEMRDNGNRIDLLAPIEQLVLVGEVERLHVGRFQSQSLPGHLLHLVTAGAVSQWAEGRAEVFGKGSVVWYHNNEPVHGKILRAPWRFITINFLSSSIHPPLDDKRVFKGSSKTIKLGKSLLANWNDQSISFLERQFRCHKILLELIQQLLPQIEHQTAPQLNDKRWWRIEKQIRTRLEEPHTLSSIQHMSGLSVRTIIRACKEATGDPPMRRLKELKLRYARNLVQHSDLPMTEIAFQVGYTRSQEFSRDYHHRFCITPRQDRLCPSAYRKFNE